MQAILVIGVYVWGGLYATGVFVAALAWQRPLAAILIIACAGLAYLCQLVGALARDTHPRQGVAFWLMLGSAMLGIAAALALFA